MARIACSVSQRSGLRPSLRRRRRNTPIAVTTTALLSFTSKLVYPPKPSPAFCHAPREKFKDGLSLSVEKPAQIRRSAAAILALRPNGLGRRSRDQAGAQHRRPHAVLDHDD